MNLAKGMTLVERIAKDGDAQDVLRSGDSALMMVTMGLQQLLVEWAEHHGLDTDDDTVRRALDATLGSHLATAYVRILTEVIGCEGCVTRTLQQLAEARVHDELIHASDDDVHIGPTEGSA